MDEPGIRNAPSLMYASFAPAFYFDSDGNPNGGFFRDGRAATLADQAIQPFITRFEMANSDAASVIERLKGRPYLAAFTALYGAEVLNDPDTALQRMGQALAAFETESVDFHPFTSKFDYWLKGQATLTTQELRGLALFNNPTKGNCSACHPSTSGDGVMPALFTDFSFDNLGLPRNVKIPSNSSATAPAYTPINSSDGIETYYDLGICGPFPRRRRAQHVGLCGAVQGADAAQHRASRGPTSTTDDSRLGDAIGFYVRRDTDPEEFYPTTADGTVTKFDDLPAAYGGQFVVNIHVPGSDANYLGNVNAGEDPVQPPHRRPAGIERRRNQGRVVACAR